VVCTVAILHPRPRLRRATQGRSAHVPRQDARQLHRERTLLLTVVPRRSEEPYFSGRRLRCVKLRLCNERTVLRRRQCCILQSTYRRIFLLAACFYGSLLPPVNTLLYMKINNTHTTVLRPSFRHYSGEQVPEEKTSSGVYGAREDNIDRHTDSPAGCNSIRNNQCPTSIIPPPFLRRMPSCRKPTTLPIYPGSGQAPNRLACIPSGLVT